MGFPIQPGIAVEFAEIIDRPIRIGHRPRRYRSIRSARSATPQAATGPPPRIDTEFAEQQDNEQQPDQTPKNDQKMYDSEEHPHRSAANSPVQIA